MNKSFVHVAKKATRFAVRKRGKRILYTELHFSLN